MPPLIVPLNVPIPLMYTPEPLMMTVPVPFSGPSNTAVALAVWVSSIVSVCPLTSIVPL